MSQLPKGNPRIPEGVNHRNQNPLKEFTQLLLATITILFTVFLILYFFAERLLVFVPFSWEEKLANQFPSVSSIISNELDNSCYDEKDLAAANKALEKLTKELAACWE